MTRTEIADAAAGAGASPASRRRRCASTRARGRTAARADTRAFSAEVGDDDDRGAEHQRARNRALGIARLLRGVGHHVPAAEREQAGDERAQEAARLRSSPAPPARAACPAPNSSDQQDARSRAILVIVSAVCTALPGPDADVVDRRQHEDAADGDQADAEVAQRDDRRRVAAEHHRDRRDDARSACSRTSPSPRGIRRRARTSRAGRRRRRRCAGTPTSARRRCSRRTRSARRRRSRRAACRRSVGTARLTSDGCTKIDEPTMVPTTIAVACVSPIERVELRHGGC